MHLGITEILLLIFLALVLFGGNKLSGVGKALGKSIKEFRNEIKSSDESESKPSKPASESESKI